mgnify:CR=1 FL=1
MRYRENIIKNIERLETTLKQLHTHINRGGTQKQANGSIEKSEELLLEIKAYVEREHRDFNEYK